MSRIRLIEPFGALEGQLDEVPMLAHDVILQRQVLLLHQARYDALALETLPQDVAHRLEPRTSPHLHEEVRPASGWQLRSQV